MCFELNKDKQELDIHVIIKKYNAERTITTKVLMVFIWLFVWLWQCAVQQRYYHVSDLLALSEYEYDTNPLKIITPQTTISLAR